MTQLLHNLYPELSSRREYTNALPVQSVVAIFVTSRVVSGWITAV